MNARRYARLLRVQVKASLLVGLQYRSDFVIEGFVEVLGALKGLLPLWVIFGSRQTIAGWTYPETLLVTGWFTLLHAVIEGAINPSLGAVVEHIRKGTLDFVLLKPADAQFLVSTAKVQPWRAINLVTALGIFAYAFARMGHPPSISGVLLSLVMLGAAVILLYSLWFLTVSSAFYVVKVDNLTYLFDSIFDAARWPSSVFRGAVRFVFTWLIPLVMMTTYPAEALLGRLPASSAVGAGLLAIALFAGSRWVWRRAIGAYTSASS